MSRIVDTDVVSYLYKGDSRANLYYPHLFGQILVISFQTVAELRRWMLSANWGARRRQHLESRLQRYVVEHSSDALCTRWAEAMESAKRNGRPIAPADAWVAATALHLGFPLVTHNRTHFLGVDGLTVLSENRS
ncbi:MAG TPA: type II toxin-antitoxin system VapC family toxin [Pyrinomonadaceae bacterium]|nr:type II toxin-antitoxin system VapC family toxin [Pyrinomonadaceae bacterium]